jgi:hypothetical protein
MYELIYTSVAKGLGGGTGYTTAAHTQGMPRVLINAVEAISTFQHIETNPLLFQKNPVGFSHLTIGTGQQRAHVVSRIAACEPDHSGRTNFIAHHVVLTAQEVLSLPDGPAALASQPRLFRRSWREPAQLLPPRSLPNDAESTAGRPAWRAAGLDPAWAEWLAKRLRSGGKTTYVIHELGFDLLPLVGDVVALLPPSQRWTSTFATYSSQVFPGIGYACELRGVIGDTPFAAGVAARSRTDCIDLTNPGPAPTVAAAVARGPASTSAKAPSTQRRPAVAKVAGNPAPAANSSDPLGADESDLLNMPLPSWTPATSGNEPSGASHTILIAVAIVVASAAVVAGVVAWQLWPSNKQVAKRSTEWESPEGLSQPDIDTDGTNPPAPQPPAPQPPAPQPPAPQPPGTEHPATQEPAAQLRTKLNSPRARTAKITLRKLKDPEEPRVNLLVPNGLGFELDPRPRGPKESSWKITRPHKEHPYEITLKRQNDELTLEFDPCHKQAPLLRFLTIQVNEAPIKLGEPCTDQLAFSRADKKTYFLFPPASHAAKDFAATLRAAISATGNATERVSFTIEGHDPVSGVSFFQPDRTPADAKKFAPFLKDQASPMLCVMKLPQKGFDAYVVLQLENYKTDEEGELAIKPLTYWAMDRADRIYRWRNNKFFENATNPSKPAGTESALAEKENAEWQTDAKTFFQDLENDLTSKAPKQSVTLNVFLPALGQKSKEPRSAPLLVVKPLGEKK